MNILDSIGVLFWIVFEILFAIVFEIVNLTIL